MSHPAREQIEEALHAAADGRPRIWPLYSGFDDETGMVRVCGWAGARIVSVERVEGGGILLRLQPAVVTHASVIADPGRSSPPVFWTENRTICAVRLAE